MSVWITDADMLDLGSKELDTVYSNNIIRSYLSKKDVFLGLAGVKGQGKTFLIKVKRKNKNQDPSVVCLPYGRMVDIVDSSMEIDSSLHNYLKDYNVWAKLWKCVICITILTSKDINLNAKVSGINAITREILSLNNDRSAPSFVLSQLLRLNIQDFLLVLKDTGTLFEYLREIHQSVCVFIDKLDQSFSRFIKNFDSDSRTPMRSRNASFWQYAQYGLAECAYDVYAGTGKHIKVFYTIRQEALIDSQLLNKDLSRNIGSFIAILNYDRYDLRQMYNLYIGNEDDKNLLECLYKKSEPSKAFVGVEELQHGYITHKKENLFDYIYRHTFKRPYDMMKICQALYNACNNQKLEPADIRHTVNIASNGLLEEYLQELSLSLPCSVLEIERFARIVPCDVLNRKIANAVCHTFGIESKEDNVWNCNKNCLNCNTSAIIVLLYNLGLLGFNKQHQADKHPVIMFASIGNRVLSLNDSSLPYTDTFYLHPALANKARDIRDRDGLPFSFSNVIIVGDGYTLSDDSKEPLTAELRRSFTQLRRERVFISSTVKDLTRERGEIRNLLIKRGLHPIMSEYPGFGSRIAHRYHSHDVCLEVIKECRSFVLILGDSYGGIYKGDEYVEQKDEIIQFSNGKITEPSITLMEYYMARKMRIRCLVLGSREIERRKANGTLDSKMVNEINFINHFTNPTTRGVRGNWIEWYEDERDLIERINAFRFI